MVAECLEARAMLRVRRWRLGSSGVEGGVATVEGKGRSSELVCCGGESGVVGLWEDVCVGGEWGKGYGSG